MDVPTQLTDVLSGHRLRLVDDDIYSVLPEGSHQHHYDKRAALYDLVVNTELYNALMWGSSPGDYVAFANRAVSCCAEGRLLDAGCGSLLFTAPTYLRTTRQIVAFDQSIAMLRRARKRLIKLAGEVPSHIVLLQGDLSDLPFHSGSFRTVLSLNVLHQFRDAAVLISNLKKLLTDDGYLFLTSLVLSNRFVGDAYLRVLHLTKEFVRPRSYSELDKLMNDSQIRELNLSLKGNMAFVTGKS